jgi:peptidoglycan-associated lipoprotein
LHCFQKKELLKSYPLYLLLLLCLTACSTAGKLEKAHRLFEEGGYAQAAKEYKRVVRRLPKDQSETPYFNYAESYRRIGKLREAENAFAALFVGRKSIGNPDIHLRYGETLLANEKFDEAEAQFALYAASHRDDQAAAMAMASLEMARSAATEKQPGGYVVEAVSVLNTPSSDFAPAYGADDYELLLLTSTRKKDNVGKKTYEVTGELFSDLYFARINRAGKWERVQNMGKIINTKYEDGAAAFNSSYTTLYFTRCRKVKREKTGCKIYASERIGDEWSEPEDLQLVPDSITAAHPALSSDDLTLYFASDLENGMGQMDIWKVSRGGPTDVWGEPVNAGVQINTPGNEMFPFARPDSSLYFASDGHPGLGGLDIFKATPDSLEGWKIENPGAPLNSPADDFSIIFERDNERGYFASRRKAKGTRGNDDIFRFAKDIQPVEYFLEGVVKNAKTGQLLDNADIRLIGSNGAILRKRTESNGSFQFRINAGLDYIAIASREGHLNGRVRFSSKGWDNGHVHRDTFLLTPTDKPIEIPNIFFDFGQAILTADSRASLDSLVGIMTDNPAIVVELRAHTDNRGTDESNFDLSQRRAQAVVDYLIRNGIDEVRLEAVGLGESDPKTVDDAIAAQYRFLRTGQRLTERFIDALPNEGEREICHQLNRRTELQVIRSNYTEN